MCLTLWLFLTMTYDCVEHKQKHLKAWVFPVTSYAVSFEMIFEIYTFTMIRSASHSIQRVKMLGARKVEWNADFGSERKGKAVTHFTASTMTSWHLCQVESTPTSPSFPHTLLRSCVEVFPSLPYLSLVKSLVAVRWSTLIHAVQYFLWSLI